MASGVTERCLHSAAIVDVIKILQWNGTEAEMEKKKETSSSA